MRPLSLETTTHGRILVEDAADGPGGGRGALVAFHGYAQAAEDILAEVAAIPGAHHWRIVAVQGLHRFYTRGDQHVVASWMTRQDREQAVADNVAWVAKAVAAATAGDEETAGSGRVVYVGFSQGAAMAYRAALLGPIRAAGIIALAGDIPPELRTDRGEWPPVLIGTGVRDTWYTREKLDADRAYLESRGVPCDVVRFDGGHEWTGVFRERAGLWLARLT